MSPTLERLAAIELFSQLSAKELRKIASFMTLIKIKAGRDLTVQGTPGREFMIIVEGEASVRRNGRLIASLGPGDFFGELAVVAGLPRTATVTAESEMLVETLNRREFSSLLDASPRLTKKILVGAVKRLHGPRRRRRPLSYEIAVVGSANLDLVVDVNQIPLVGETVMGGDLHRYPGGKGGQSGRCCRAAGPKRGDDRPPRG